MKIHQTLLRGVTVAVAAAAIIGCQSSDKRVADSASGSTTPADVKAAAAENASRVMEITFDKDSSVLNEASRRALAESINAANSAGEIEDIKIMAWSDADYPAEGTQKLSKKEFELADARASAIRDYVKSFAKADDVDTYNMAKRPNELQRMFNTEDARLKHALERAGVSNSESAGQTKLSKASRALVMIIMDEDQD